MVWHHSYWRQHLVCGNCRKFHSTYRNIFGVASKAPIISAFNSRINSKRFCVRKKNKNKKQVAASYSLHSGNLRHHLPYFHHVGMASVVFFDNSLHYHTTYTHNCRFFRNGTPWIALQYFLWLPGSLRDVLSCVASSPGYINLPRTVLEFCILMQCCTG